MVIISQHLLILLMGHRFGSPVSITRCRHGLLTDWSKEIANALTSSDIILDIWTKNASNSSYVKNEWLTARALGKLIKLILFSKDKLNEELPQPLRNLQAIVDFHETKNIEASIQKLVASLKKILPPLYL